ncbi:hypothetical protein ACS3UN_13105 [Oscillospiraceae bacterium LTW-04]|nr:hypothetical protein RBH76_00915 [Oscillospiraceae bacterium MB24-C1]
MIFDSSKTEDCFSDSQTYEYRLPVTAQTFVTLLAGWNVTENHRYRRPMFSADKNGVNIKGVLSGNVIKVSFPYCEWEAEKADFEGWLGGLKEE